MLTLEELLTVRPAFHRPETEVARAIEPSESLLPAAALAGLTGDRVRCWGLQATALAFLARHTTAESRTLEIGAGCSTLVFALQGSAHVAVTPNGDEVQRIRAYALEHGVSLDRVTFVTEASESYLPTCALADLDLVLLDGKHAFPWPMLDWFFTADRLRVGGLIVLDDVTIGAVRVLVEFLAADPRWTVADQIDAKTIAFRKLAPNVHDVAWHMQPFSLPAREPAKRPSLLARVRRRLSRPTDSLTSRRP